MSSWLTTDEVQTYGNIAEIDTSLLAMMIEAACTNIERYCKRDFGIKNRDEYLDCNGGYDLILPEYPVLDITEITFYSLCDGSESDKWTSATDPTLAATFVWNSKTGIVQRRDNCPFPAGTNTTRVKFRAGVLPDQVKLAAMEIIKHIGESMTVNPAVKKEQIHEGLTEYFAQFERSKDGWPSWVRQMLDPYVDHSKML